MPCGVARALVPVSGLRWTVHGHILELSPELVRSQGRKDPQVRPGAGTCHCSVPQMTVIFPFPCPQHCLVLCYNLVTDPHVQPSPLP